MQRPHWVAWLLCVLNKQVQLNIYQQFICTANMLITQCLAIYKMVTNFILASMFCEREEKDTKRWQRLNHEGSTGQLFFLNFFYINIVFCPVTCKTAETSQLYVLLANSLKFTSKLLDTVHHCRHDINRIVLFTALHYCLVSTIKPVCKVQPYLMCMSSVKYYRRYAQCQHGKPKLVQHT